MSNVIQRNFSGGEIAPALHSRVDQVKYSTGLKTCRNLMIMRHGGLTNRPGTGYIAEVSDSSKQIRLIPFLESNYNYILEFGNLYIRVYRNTTQGYIEGVDGVVTITGATKANPCVITYSPNNLVTGDEVYIYGVIGMTELNGRHYKFTQTGTGTGELDYMDGTNVNSTSFGTYVSGGTGLRVYQITTPYVEADLRTLQVSQSQGVLTIVHPNYAPRQLTKGSGAFDFTLSTISFGASISSPTGVGCAPTGTTNYYVVTAVATETSEESLASSSSGGGATPVTITWNAVSGAGLYNIYKLINGTYGWIGVAGGTSFIDTGYTADMLDSPPVARTPFGSTGNYPSAVTAYQQRSIYANTDNNEEKVWTSKSGLPNNLMISTPLQDDDAVTFSLIGRNVNSVKYILDIGRLIIFTSTGEWVIEGNAAGVLTPSEINPRQHTANGSADIAPLVVGGNALYVQARGGTVRDLGYDYETSGYKGNELTIFASHLFDGYTITAWAYQQIPHSIVWCVRSDGALIGLTYIREHQIFGWHRHDTDGIVEDVAVISGTTEDILFMVVKRTVNSKVVRYIEYLKTRHVTDVENAVFMDCSMTWDGYYNGSNNMTLSGGTNWTYDETLTLTTAIGGYFTAADVGNGIHFTSADGDIIRFTITGYTSGTVVTGKAHKTVPADLRGIATLNWKKAIVEVIGLWHLEGKGISVFADGFVVANPNNPAYNPLTVTNGSIMLDRPYATIHVGLPITADMETLDIDIVGTSTLSDKKKLINKLSMRVESSRGIWAGPDEDNLREFKLRSTEDYDEPTNLITGMIDINIKSEWHSSGRIFIRQTDPVPLSVLAVVPTGYI